ncbi:MAG: acetyltransferase [Endomicrobiia bacterium]|nr:acetyltransferase [Endomicrobiia bacterium]
MDIVLLGARGHALDFIKNIEEYNLDASRAGRLHIVCLVDDVSASVPDELCGYPVVRSLSAAVSQGRRREAVKAVIAAGDPTVKKKIASKAEKLGLEFFTFVHPSVKIHRTSSIGQGSSVFAGAVISACCVIGNHVSVNYGATISHGCRLGDFATLSPCANIGGNVKISEGCFVGINACCSNDIAMGQWSVAGAGAVVIRDVPALTVVAGNPAAKIKTRNKNVPVI